MRIGFLCFGYPPNAEPGGIRVFIRTLAERLIPLGHTPVVISQESNPRRPRVSELVDGVKVYRFQSSQVRPRMISQRLQFQRVLESVVGQEKLDIVESYEDQGILLRRVPGCPLVVRFHTSDTVRRKVKRLPRSRVGEFFERRLLKIADERVGVSEWLARTTMELLRLPRLSCRVIYNGVDTGMFTPAVAVAGTPGLILFSGALIERKGLPALFKAIPEVLRRFPNARLRCVGADPKQPVFPSDLSKHYLNSLPVDMRPRVEFTGPFPHEQMPAEYRKAELCVFPSVLEGHPLTVLEAMACGAPVVFTREGVGPEVITNEEDGFLCDVSNPKELASTICHAFERCRSDPGIRERARHKVESRFSLTQAVAANVALYDEVIRGGHRA